MSKKSELHRSRKTGASESAMKVFKKNEKEADEHVAKYEKKRKSRKGVF